MSATRLNPEYNGIKFTTASLGTVQTNSSGYYTVPQNKVPVDFAKVIAVVVHHWSNTSPVSAISAVRGSYNSCYVSAGANVTVTGLVLGFFYRD